MNEITPPKLMPPFHITAASGTLPIEHTNDRIATIGNVVRRIFELCAQGLGLTRTAKTLTSVGRRTVSRVDALRSVCPNHLAVVTVPPG